MFLLSLKIMQCLLSSTRPGTCYEHVTTLQYSNGDVIPMFTEQYVPLLLLYQYTAMKNRHTPSRGKPTKLTAAKTPESRNGRRGSSRRDHPRWVCYADAPC